MTTTPSEMVAMGRTDYETRLDQIRVMLVVAAILFLTLAGLIVVGVVNL